MLLHLMPASGESLQRLMRWLERGAIVSEAGLLRALRGIPPASENANRPGTSDGISLAMLACLYQFWFSPHPVSAGVEWVGWTCKS